MRAILLNLILVKGELLAEEKILTKHPQGKTGQKYSLFHPQITQII